LAIHKKNPDGDQGLLTLQNFYRKANLRQIVRYQNFFMMDRTFITYVNNFYATMKT